MSTGSRTLSGLRVCVFASCISRSQDDGARIGMVVECTCAALHRRDDTVQLDAIPHGGQISMLMYVIKKRKVKRYIYIYIPIGSTLNKLDESAVTLLDPTTTDAASQKVLLLPSWPQTSTAKANVKTLRVITTDSFLKLTIPQAFQF